MSDEIRCSFGKRKRSEVRVLVQGIAAAICNECVARVESRAFVAHCQMCFPKDGRHAPGCPESGRRA